MLSIIVVNYKVKDELFSCIESIYKSRPKINFEIIIVDNDENKTIENEFKNKFRYVRYIKSEKNLGFGAGNNLGATYARGKYLFFLNPDTRILGKTLDNLHRSFIKNKNAGIISPVFVDNNLKPIISQGSEELTPKNFIFSQSFLRKIFPHRNIYNENALLDWNMKFSRETDTVPGAAMMMSLSLFRRIGGFDEKLFLYFEENDISKRIRALELKLYIEPSAKIIHSVGKSTRQLKNIETIYASSRYFYLRKHYGLIMAIFTNMILSINKTSIFILSIITLGFFLRVFNLGDNMSFIGDQGWFYLSARDMLLSGKTPLVGITSSHTWLHQGPLWTYVIAVIFWIFNFNPIAPAYFTALLGTFTILLFYKILSEIYSKQAGLIAALLYATSPLVILNDRFAYHTSLIPFFTLILIYTFYKWLNGKIIFFPLIVLALSFLYNLELFTTVLWIIFILFFIYGLIRKEPWLLNLNKKIIFLSLISFLIPMTPVFIYDVNHGFHQTLIFVGWIFYKSFLFIGRNHTVNIFPLADYLWLNYQKLIYPLSSQISLFLLLGSIGFFTFSLKGKKYFNCFVIVSIFALLISVLINKSPSDAYLPVFFPFLILTVSVSLAWLTKITEIRMVIIAFVLIISGFNSIYITANRFYSSKNLGIANRIRAVDKIIKLVKKEDFNLIGKGEGSQFKSFTMNYEYLLWWKGYPVSNKPQKVKIIISEDSNGAHIDNGSQ